jgi:hypothetical protein
MNDCVIDVGEIFETTNILHIFRGYIIKKYIYIRPTLNPVMPLLYYNVCLVSNGGW